MEGSSFLANKMKAKRLLRYLAIKSLALPTDKITKLSNQGFSGEVYSLDSDREEFILKFYRAYNERTVAKERQIYQFLSQHNVPLPKLYLTDLKGQIVGRPFLMLQKIKGERFSELLKKGKGRNFVKAMALSLHKLHSIDIQDLSLELPKRGFNEEITDLKVIAGVFLPFSMATKTFSRVYKVLTELSTYNIEGNPLALLHGDCGPDNIIYSDGTVYLIDLESTYFGDPAYDLGYAYHGLRLGAHSKPELADYFIETYESLHGRVRDLQTYKRLAALKIGILVKFIHSLNLLTLFLVGFRRTINLIAGQKRKTLAYITDYSLTYAEKGEAKLKPLN